MEITIALVILAAVVAVGVFVIYSRAQKSRRLRDRFGVEYDHAVSQSGQRDAERDLAERERRVERLEIREIAPERRIYFAEEWRSVQARFVDDPSQAIQDAQRLVDTLLDERGYPVATFERQAADLSADHADVVMDYRAAHAIAQASMAGTTSTEDLRQGMIHYRALFAELLGATTVS